jgi:nucleoside phosphorylase
MRSLPETTHRPKRKASGSLSPSGHQTKKPRETETARISREPAVHVDTDEESDSKEYDEIVPEDITIAIFCALPYEAVAVRYTLDGEYTCRSKGRDYVYSFGKIAEHKVVIAQSQIGTIEAAYCASAVSQEFPNVRLALMVGIGAGIPSPTHDIRLGDLAISIPKDGHSGVLQYDFGKYEENYFQLKGCLNKPPRILISADGALLQDQLMTKRPLRKILRKITSANPGFMRPDTDDILYEQDFQHVNTGSDCSGCEAASERKITIRPPRQDQQPVIHRGLILSGNGVIKNSRDRNKFQRHFKDAICYEMEAAGIMDQIPCLVVRGICDYADTHKQDNWHYYAAAVAAAYCKALLMKVHSQEVEEVPRMQEVMKGVKEVIDGVSQLRNAQRHGTCI